MTPLSSSEREQARRLFDEQSCNVCHGENGEGVEAAGPALRKLTPYWSVDRIAAYIADPGAFRNANLDFEDRREETSDLAMPAFDHLSDDERRLLARWLLAR